jgi:hypothetical protein
MELSGEKDALLRLGVDITLGIFEAHSSAGVSGLFPLLLHPPDKIEKCRIDQKR